MNKDVEVITLEDGIEYVIIKEVDRFVYLANINNAKDLVVRKKIVVNDEIMLAGLDNEEELNEALEYVNKGTRE